MLRSSEKQVATAARSGHPRRLAPTWSGCHAASNTQANVCLVGSSVRTPSSYPAKRTQPRKGKSYAALTEGTGEAHDLHGRRGGEEAQGSGPQAQLPGGGGAHLRGDHGGRARRQERLRDDEPRYYSCWPYLGCRPSVMFRENWRSEEHTSELQSRQYLVCRLLLEKKNSMQLDDCPFSLLSGI